eukprot:PhM_4_TR18640/c4_g1_i2/m.23289
MSEPNSVMQWFSTTPTTNTTSKQPQTASSSSNNNTGINVADMFATTPKSQPPLAPAQPSTVSASLPSNDGVVYCLTPNDITSLCDKVRRGHVNGSDIVVRHLVAVYSAAGGAATSADDDVDGPHGNTPKRGSVSQPRSSSPNPAFAGSTFDRSEPAPSSLKGPPTSWL